MEWRLCLSAVLFVHFLVGGVRSQPLPRPFRPPAVPLVVVDPYLSIWSMTDNLYDDVTRHWSGRDIGLSGMIRINEKIYRFMSTGSDLAPNVIKQVDLQVHPTQTIYLFADDVSSVSLSVTFTTPSILSPNDPVPSLPTTYVTFSVYATPSDNKTHNVQIYFDSTAQGVVSNTDQYVKWERHNGMPGRDTMRFEARDPQVLSNGDMINWGYWYISTMFTEGVQTSMSPAEVLRTAFINNKPLPVDDTGPPRKCSDNWPAMGVVFDMGDIGDVASRTVQIMYDQVLSVRYYGVELEPSWRHQFGGDILQLIEHSEAEQMIEKCNLFDRYMYDNLTSLAGPKYAALCSLAYRQVLGSTVTVWNSAANQTWMFLKDISKGGDDTNTVDAIYSASPLFLATNPQVLKLLLLPILNLANNDTGNNSLCNTACAPHGLGEYPVCNGECNYEQPLEETGDMLQMLAAIVQLTDRNIDFLMPYWGLLKQWADFIIINLPSPPLQKSENFEEPSANNVNLATKGIVGLAAYSYLLRQHGLNGDADYYDKYTRDFTEYWLKNALEGDHYKRQFDLPVTSWSLKYNLFYHDVLGLVLFRPYVKEKDIPFYLKWMDKYGIPLDDRLDYTKADYLMWIAAMGNEEQFNAITDAVYTFADETTDRVPFPDLYYSWTGKMKLYKARPAIGGLFGKLLLSIISDKQ